ncbi:hypothetical protein H8S37_04400 [Mediterraneibacter sp. NSJ-55]|uniref:Uncharacterized protein n=1 Tax=Mediterraneibacter hominis TaxID=2763054 RepID=A0A923LH34_9FIRM|nr:hypothetical protein [Mediterraneibacter hominis]MBC5688174.1 hypothetical protein [Mediterraneibacter hominis]
MMGNMVSQKVKDFAYMARRIKEVGATIEAEYNYSRNCHFRYFMYKGQKINIDEVNEHRAASFYWTRKNIDTLFDEILLKITDEKRKVYIECRDMLEEVYTYHEFTWGHREYIGTGDINYVFTYVVK